MSKTFKSFEEALNHVTNPTHYETERGIKVVDTKVMIEATTMRLVYVSKSDGTRTFFIFYKPSRKYEIWVYWCPDKIQLELLKYVVPSHILDVEQHNGGGVTDERRDKDFPPGQTRHFR